MRLRVPVFDVFFVLVDVCLGRYPQLNPVLFSVCVSVRGRCVLFCLVFEFMFRLFDQQKKGEIHHELDFACTARSLVVNYCYVTAGVFGSIANADLLL